MTGYGEHELEQRLRRVLQEEAATMSPGPGGLDQIRVQANQPVVDRGRPGWLWPTLAAAAVAAVVIGFVVIPGLAEDDEPDPATSPTPSATSEPPTQTPTPTPTQSPTPTTAPTPTAPAGGASTEIYSADGMPFMVIETPAVQGATAVLRGTAVAFEATVNWELRNPEQAVLDMGFVTASEGGPGRGTWEVTIPGLASGSYVFEAYEASAQDGRKLHIATATFTIP